MAEKRRPRNENGPWNAAISLSPSLIEACGASCCAMVGAPMYRTSVFWRPISIPTREHQPHKMFAAGCSRSTATTIECQTDFSAAPETRSRSSDRHAEATEGGVPPKQRDKRRRQQREENRTQHRTPATPPKEYQKEERGNPPHEQKQYDQQRRSLLSQQ